MTCLASPTDLRRRTLFGALDRGEMITAVVLSSPDRQVHRKVRGRASRAFALVCVVDAVSGRVRSSRLAPGGVAPRPCRAPALRDPAVVASTIAGSGPI